MTTDLSRLAAVIWASVSMAAASPVSNCINDVGDSGFACNFFETLANGTASQSSNVVSFPVGQSVVAGYVVLLESPSASHTDPTEWSDVLQFIDGGSGQATSGQLFSYGCNCFPISATVNAAPSTFVLETQTGQGNDFSDSTQFNAGFNTFNMFSAAPNTVPEPASGALVGSALVLVVVFLTLTRPKERGGHRDPQPAKVLKQVGCRVRPLNDVGPSSLGGCHHN
jgi:hypothetical protein